MRRADRSGRALPMRVRRVGDQRRADRRKAFLFAVIPVAGL
ncbi:MAG: hypothetical protein WA890_07235 [Micromonospora sp.]